MGFFSEIFNWKKSKVEDKPLDRILIEYKLNKYPDDYLFLIEADVSHRAYINENTYIESVVYEDGTAYYKKYDETGECKITAKEYDEALKKIGKKPIEIEFRRYMLEDGEPLDIYKIDNDVIVGVVEFYDKDEALRWEMPNEMIPCIIEKDSNYKKYFDYSYWSRTRLADNN